MIRGQLFIKEAMHPLGSRSDLHAEIVEMEARVNLVLRVVLRGLRPEEQALLVSSVRNAAKPSGYLRGSAAQIGTACTIVERPMC
jgi:hypothetical protein